MRLGGFIGRSEQDVSENVVVPDIVGQGIVAGHDEVMLLCTWASQACSGEAFQQ